MSSRYPMQSVCENPFQGGWKQQAAFYPTSRQPWIATAAALTMGRFVQSWRDSNVSLGIKRPMVSASAAAAANNLEKTSGSEGTTPEIFSRTAPAATAAALTMGRFGFLMPSSTSLRPKLA